MKEMGNEKAVKNPLVPIIWTLMSSFLYTSVVSVSNSQSLLDRERASAIVIIVITVMIVIERVIMIANKFLLRDIYVRRLFSATWL